VTGHYDFVQRKRLTLDETHNIFHLNVGKGVVLLATAGFDTYLKDKKSTETIAKVAA